jgi:DNA-binding transcriptional MerR regulator
VAQEAVLNKAPDAFRTISEVAADLDLPQHVLRFWESRFPHIKPLKRGGGRRYYRPEDVDLLRGIRRLLYADGYTIRGVQRILREQGIRTVQSVGQGQAPTLALQPQDDADDGPGDNGALTAATLLPPSELRPRNGAEDDSEGPVASPPARPQNGPVVQAGIVAVPLAARAAAQAGAAPVAATPPLAAMPAVGVPSTPAATRPSPPGMAAQDLEKLKRALATLEACRRLLDKAIEEGS